MYNVVVFLHFFLSSIKISLLVLDSCGAIGKKQKMYSTEGKENNINNK